MDTPACVPRESASHRGSNGAGKTTFARRYLQFAGPEIPFVNGDKIAALLDPDAPQAVAQRAGRTALKRMGSYVARRTDFAFETTLSGRSYARRLEGWRRHGYRIGLIYLRLPSADHVVRRVAQRVSEGGHDIPEPVARRRFERSWHNFVELYRPIADEWQVYDTSNRSPILVAASERNDILPLLPSGWRIRESPTAADADGRDLPVDFARRSAMTEDRRQAPDRFPEGEPSIENVMIALKQARDDALARAAAVRRRESEAARAENASSTAEN
ncbi:MAG: AAA family ATPase [Gemmatimonadales bacterium]|nr:AAA family ATPase [Gemmatimonadales bacterium]MYG48638.1 AAA family ATPase [Gemmatimonadales bacterium]MYK01742.1 AAA family ATPase [Candidatus Palauibacter ramosifaciens]